MLSIESIKLERLHAMCKNARQSSSSYSNSSSYNSRSRQPLKYVIVSLCCDTGYSYGAEIFWNVEAMQAKEVAVKDKQTAAKATKTSKVGIDIECE